MTKVPCQSSTVFLLQQILPHGEFRNTQLIAPEQQSFLDNVLFPLAFVPKNWILSYFMCLIEILIICVHVPEIIKTERFDFELLQQQTLPAQSINNFVSSTGNMFNHKSEILHILNPFDMSLIQLFLLSHKLQCMIVTV
jgi:hypothetical protein